MDLNSTVYIMRGLPGSGKTTHALHLKKTLETRGFTVDICSADDGHMIPAKDGKLIYRFDPAKIDAAHGLCLCRFVGFVRDYCGEPNCAIFVDNTNTSALEIAPYYRLARAYKFDVVVVEMRTHPAVCLSRQTHDVPPMTIGAMMERMKQPLPSEWKYTLEVVQSSQEPPATDSP